jgi:cell division protein FtsI (penicillin-binding protein 3)
MKQFSHQSDIFELSKNRRRVVLSLILLLFLMLFSRALYLQQIKKDFLQNKGDGFSVKNEVLQSYRGKIYDRNNNLLAVSSPTFDIGLSISHKLPKKHNDQIADNLSKENISEISKTLKIDEKLLLKKIENKKKGYIYIQKSVSPETAKKLTVMRIPVLNFEKKYTRYYPNREASAHIVGKTDLNGVEGTEGLERQWDSILREEKGHKKVVVDGVKRVIDDLNDFKLPKNGSDILTTIDNRLQHIAYEALKKYIDRYEANSGSAILIDAKNGDILVMTNYPSYNPNGVVKSYDSMRNRAITDVFEPGSTLKPISVAYAMEKKKVKHNEIIDTKDGFIRVGGRVIKDDHPQDQMSVKEIIQKSSNVGATKIGQRLESKDLWGLYNKLGFGAKINVGMPGESNGRLPEYSNWKEIDHATLTYGYGVNMNLLQLVKAYTVFANDGLMIKPKLYKNDNFVETERVLSSSTSKIMKDFMKSVVEEEEGTGTKARIPGYTVAGKTGTARKYHNGEYSKDYFASFIGMSPSSDPRFIAAVIVDTSTKKSFYGGTVAGPIFKDVMKNALKLYDVPYDKEINENLMNNKVVKPKVDDVQL